MRCQVMGIVNVTPDSFSDGGKFFTPEEAIRRAKNLVEEGAAIIDLGGESTRPGATPLTWQEEWARLEPVIDGLIESGVGLSAPVVEDHDPDWSEAEIAEGRTVLSIDTYHPETMERALAKGATIINCVYPEPVPEMLKLLDRYPEAELVLPASCVTEGTVDLGLKTRADRLILDPMIGFGTTREEDLAILKSIPELAAKGRVLIGASRKRIVKKLTGTKVPGKDLAGNLTIAVWAALKGASIVRVHDVRETVQALKVLSALV